MNAEAERKLAELDRKWDDIFIENLEMAKMLIQIGEREKALVLLKMVIGSLD